MSAPSGQYPAATYTSATCEGTTFNSITTAGYAGEYALVNVTSGQTYQFRSSIATDFVTISTDNGITAAAYGTTPVTWIATLTGQVRFYTHLDDQCGAQATSRTKSVVCGASLASNSFDLK